MMKRFFPLVISVLVFLFSLNSVRAQDFEVERERMVKFQIEDRGVVDQEVLRVMRRIERHRFVPSELQSLAYEDMPLPIGEGQTISQPYIVALMTELLELKGHEKVLEIGTGSGYQAAILAELAGQVYSIEILVPLAERAQELLNGLGYKNIKIKRADGFLGWPQHAPFDAIMVTCAAKEIPRALVEQLSEGGRMVIPQGDAYQELKLLIKVKGEIKEKRIIRVRFVPMLREE
ncbi:MAG: protein-L-isoaspartate(D-aspartate) O-methyltransferase [Candidatus Omnitrophota bacterium]